MANSVVNVDNERWCYCFYLLELVPKEDGHAYP